MREGDAIHEGLAGAGGANKIYDLEVGTWDVNEVQLQMVLAHMTGRPEAVFLQEGHCPEDAGMMICHNYSAFMPRPERTDACVPVMVRKDIAMTGNL